MPNNVEGAAAVRPLHVLRHPAVELVRDLSDRRGRARSSAAAISIKKVLFPAEVLPLVSVLTNMVHFFLGLPILILFLIIYRHSPDWWDLVWFPIAVLVQLVFTAGLAPGAGGARRALQGHPRHPRQRADAVVLRHADHLSVVPAQRPDNSGRSST